MAEMHGDLQYAAQITFETLIPEHFLILHFLLLTVSPTHMYSEIIRVLQRSGVCTDCLFFLMQ